MSRTPVRVSVPLFPSAVPTHNSGTKYLGPDLPDTTSEYVKTSAANFVAATTRPLLLHWYQMRFSHCGFRFDDSSRGCLADCSPRGTVRSIGYAMPWIKDDPEIDVSFFMLGTKRTLVQYYAQDVLKCDPCTGY